MRVSFESGRGDHLVVRRLGGEEQPPAADARDGHRRGVVDAVTLRDRWRRRASRIPAAAAWGDRVLVHRQTWLLRLTLGDRGVQRRRVGQRPDDDLVRVWSPPVPALGWVASSAALELRKYSVPPFAVSKEPVPGDCAGQTVKPGWVAPASLGALTMPDVSMCTIVDVRVRPRRAAPWRARRSAPRRTRCSTTGRRWW